ncbi:Eco57I restriction-modification methylase domain-containing protein [Flavobacterium sp.]|uniref:Eco57I restriction-modification methylase domain-containing protein n=1 Tax=Flavobacterium sp. TaxID=239 RepID=UPI00375107A5
MIETNYNPDVLTCLANLSNDEVFTPPNLANQMLDILPQDLFSNSKTAFLDPVSKSGVFLREIAKRLMKGLEKEFPDQQERLNHIFNKQLFGIAITELTSLLSRRSLYCSKIANSKYSICETFTNEKGNILFDKVNHTWKNGKCTFCNASQEVYDREEALETYAYQFIHTNNPEKIFKKMKFDVIIGNPPYQLSDDGHGKSAKPIYQKFIQQAKKLNPRYLSMIIPARWYAGGKGLDEFRAEMLGDKKIRKIVDFENSNEVFPGVDVAGGICYFLWDKDNEGLCEITNFKSDEIVKLERALDEFPILIRQSKAIPIIRKVQLQHGIKSKFLNDLVSSRKPFGLPTNYTPTKKGIPCWYTQKIGLQFAREQDVSDDKNLLNKWKLLVPPAPIAGQTDFSKPIGFYYDGNTKLAKPNECCTESFIVAGAFSTEAETKSFKSYLFTKTVRFLLLQTVVSQHVTKQNFALIPDLGTYDGIYTDEMLCKKWGINPEEWEFIDSKIKATELMGNRKNEDNE